VRCITPIEPYEAPISTSLLHQTVPRQGEISSRSLGKAKWSFFSQ
jgi:hypothetical protein